MDNDHITPETVNAELENLEFEAGNDPAQVAIDGQAQQLQVDSQNEWKEILQHLIGPAVGLLAPGWNVKAVEIDALAEAYSGLLNKYFPGGASQIGPELGAAMVTVAIIGPRLKMPRQLPEKKVENDGD